MKWVCSIIGALALTACGTGAPHQSAGANIDEAAVEQAFQAWADGTGSPFTLLSDSMRWTIIGSTRAAGTYDRESFDALVKPFNERLEKPLRPTAWEIYAKDDQVVIHFVAQAPLKTGELYENEYAWFFRFEDGEAVAVRAFLDLAKFEQALGAPLP